MLWKITERRWWSLIEKSSSETCWVKSLGRGMLTTIDDEQIFFNSRLIERNCVTFHGTRAHGQEKKGELSNFQVTNFPPLAVDSCSVACDAKAHCHKSALCELARKSFVKGPLDSRSNEMVIQDESWGDVLNYFSSNLSFFSEVSCAFPVARLSFFPFFLFLTVELFRASLPCIRLFFSFSQAIYRQLCVKHGGWEGASGGKNKKNRFAIIFTLFFHAMLELTQVQWRQCCERMRIFTKWFDEFLFWSSLSRFFLNSHFSSHFFLILLVLHAASHQHDTQIKRGKKYQMSLDSIEEKMMSEITWMKWNE